MKIGFASRWSPLDKKSWSGICYYSYRQIREHFDVEIFHYTWPRLLRDWLTTQKSLNRKLFNKGTSVEFLKSYARYFSKQLQKDLEKRPVDILFISASPQLIAYLETDIPIIFMIDATFKQINGYYPYFSNLAGYNSRQGIELDKRAFRKASHCMLTTVWNKNSAVTDYGIDEKKISVVPCGANLDAIPAADELHVKNSGSCRLLFLGVEWERKGGDIALETFQVLKKKGVHPVLTIIGCIPPHDLTQEKNITIIPFLDKNDPADMKRLDNIFRQTDFLLLPSRAECSGVVFSEASAYGIPSITTDTGGVSTCVKNDLNGFTLPLQAGAEAYAETIASVWADPGRISSLKISSRQYYENNLSWELWGKRFREIVEMLHPHPDN